MNIKNLMAITIASAVAILMTGTTMTQQQAFAPAPAFCTKYIEDGATINACFSGERGKKECQNTAEELSGTKCEQIKKFEF
jgi:hypothetical protein